jgi:hypothetical protein
MPGAPPRGGGGGGGGGAEGDPGVYGTRRLLEVAPPTRPAPPHPGSADLHRRTRILRSSASAGAQGRRRRGPDCPERAGKGGDGEVYTGLRR